MVGRKEKIMLWLVLVLLPLSGWARHNEKTDSLAGRKSKSGIDISYGIKAGFNSSMFILDEFVVNGTTINDMQNRYKLGYNISLFARFGKGRHFLQTGPEFSIINGEIKFDKKASQHPDIEPDYAYIISNIKSVNLPVMYGYSIVNEHPYNFSVFAGPVFKYIWENKSNIEFVNLFNDVDESLSAFAVNLALGVSVKISYIFFDFAYEVGLNNISKSIQRISEPNERLVLDRRNNTISFSIGCTF